MDRELMEPHRVMEAGVSGMSLGSSGPVQPGHDGGVGEFNVGNLDCLKKGEVNLGVRPPAHPHRAVVAGQVRD